MRAIATQPSPDDDRLTKKVQEISSLLRSIGWWLMLLICIAYAGFALDMFRIELVSLISNSPIEGAKPRNTPIAFLLHAVLGGVGLVCGALQLNQSILLRRSYIHRRVGWTYLIAIWGASLTGIYNSIYFDIHVSARAIFILVGSWWFLSTTIGYLQNRKRNVKRHQCWMLRSFAMSLFFVNFPIWVPVLQYFVRDAIAWPAGLFWAAGLNIVAGEWWIYKRLTNSAAILDRQVSGPSPQSSN